MDQIKDTYYPISRFYKETFGEKVYKIPVTIVDTCPNRMGLKDMETCIFCDDWGSAAFEDSFEKTLREQIETYRDKFVDRYGAKKFLVYFQAYTNSLAGIEKLRSYYDLALSYDFVEGIVVGTRPDCLSPSLLRLWKEYSEKVYFSVELGIQSYFEEHVQFLKRGHKAQKSIDGIMTINKACPKVDIGIHFIFGIPGETDEHIVESAKITNSLPVHNVKFHNLHVLKNTGLEKLYNEGLYEPIELEEYGRKCALFIDHLKPGVPIHRLGAIASRWDEVIAPQWIKYKMKSFQALLDEVNKNGSQQGRLYKEMPNYAMTNFPTHLHHSKAPTKTEISPNNPVID